MNISFKGQKVLVTGGSRGIGQAIVKAFLESSADLVVATGTKEKSPEFFENFFSKEEQAHLQYRKLNLLHKDKNQDINKLIEEFGHFDVCVNNAGINIVEGIDEFNEQHLSDVLEVNLVGPALVVSKLCQSMKEKKYGRIVNITSIFGQVTKSCRLNYSSSKFGLIGQTKSIALDLAKYNILVNSLSPGFIATDLTKRVLGEEGVKEMMRQVPLGRLGQPEEIATGVLFLASKNNTFITAETLTMDGGFLAT